MREILERDEEALGLAVLAGLVFFFSFFIHSPWSAPNIYSDIVSVFQRPKVAAGTVPYLDYLFEYPVIVGLVVYVSSAGAVPLSNYLFRMGFLLGTVAVVATVLLYKILKIVGGGNPEKSSGRIITYFLFAPTMLIYGFYNWDLFSVLFTLLALYAFKTDRTTLSAVALSLGAASKIYSGALLPVLLSALDSWRNRVRYVGIFAVTWLLVNLPFMAANFGQWYQTFVFLANWGLENSWMRLFFPQFSQLARLTGLGLFIWVILRVMTLKADLIEKCLIASLAWLVTSYISTPQMVQWVLPFYAILGISRTWFYTTELTNALIILTWFTQPDPLSPLSLTQQINLLRQGLWAAMMIYLLAGKPHIFNTRAIIHSLFSPVALKH